VSTQIDCISIILLLNNQSIRLNLKYVEVRGAKETLRFNGKCAPIYQPTFHCTGRRGKEEKQRHSEGVRMCRLGSKLFSTKLEQQRLTEEISQEMEDDEQTVTPAIRYNVCRDRTSCTAQKYQFPRSTQDELPKGDGMENLTLASLEQSMFDGNSSNLLPSAGYRQFEASSTYKNLVLPLKASKLSDPFPAPDVTKPIIWCSDHSGFVYVRLTELSTLAPKEPHEDLKVLLDDTSFLATNKLLCWFEGLITSALNGLPRDAHARTYLDVIRNRSHPDDILRLYIEARKSGPAFTLHLYGKDDSNTDIKLDIDLVPCFKFNETQWSNKYKKFSAKKYKV
ncbi:hypothetical protein YQE_11153, partial [Dendroctonus ponderosae]